MTLQRRITVRLADIDRVCHACGRVRKSTEERTYKAKNYMGRCGDSFCAASCDSPSCFPVTRIVCAACAKAGKVPPKPDGEG